MAINYPRLSDRRRGVTLLELVTVLLILSILSTIAVNVYVGQTLRAKISATKNQIRELSVAAVRYEIDTGELPLSGSGQINGNPGALPQIVNRVAPAGVASLTGRNGCGFLYTELVHSLSGSTNAPYPFTWGGPYLEFSSGRILATNDTGTVLPVGSQQFLDPFGAPYEYINYLEYPAGVSQQSHLGIGPSPAIPAYSGQGTQLFSGARPATASPDLPANNVYYATETYYNPRTFQIYSFGPNTTSGLGATYLGAELDDVNNFTF